VLGEELSMDALLGTLLDVESHSGRAGDPHFETHGSLPSGACDESAAVLWVGSIGYERFRDVADFVNHVRGAGVERLNPT
jgi:hypothetical protein